MQPTVHSLDPMMGPNSLFWGSTDEFTAGKVTEFEPANGESHANDFAERGTAGDFARGNSPLTLSDHAAQIHDAASQPFSKSQGGKRNLTPD